MSQVSAKLRAAGEGDLVHWCPGCEGPHVLPVVRGSWTFDGNMAAPTCTPSFAHRWTTPKGPRVCHYILTAGILLFQPDCTHALRGQSVPLPDLPESVRD